MSKEKYLVAIDLDGTLLRDDKTISSTTKNYLRKFENEGNIVVITSGRAPRSVISYQNFLGIEGPYSCYNGTYAYINDVLPLIEHKLNKDILKNIYKKVINNEVNSVMSEDLKTIFYDKDNESLKNFFDRKDMKVIQGDIDKILDSDPYIFIMDINEPYEINKNKLIELFKSIPDYEIRFWNDVQFAEIYKKGVNKASTLRKIVEFCNVNEENVLVFGDETNDEDLLKSFKHSFLMCNGNLLIKDHAKYVTKKDNNNGGVIFSIQEFISKRK